VGSQDCFELLAGTRLFLNKNTYIRAQFLLKVHNSSFGSRAMLLKKPTVTVGISGNACYVGDPHRAGGPPPKK
jgi:hypothetical protein